MNYKDYQNARDAAWRILIDCGAYKLPIPITAICKSLGIPVKLYTPSDENDGQSLLLNGCPVIFVSKTVAPVRQRFTISHELGHIILGHVGQFELLNREPAPFDNPIEQAANVFASRLLAPACVLWGCQAKTAEEISALCGISQAAAEFRAKRLEDLYRRDRFLTSPLEREVYTRFLPYIKSNRL